MIFFTLVLMGLSPPTLFHVLERNAPRLSVLVVPATLVAVLFLTLALLAGHRLARANRWNVPPNFVLFGPVS